MINKIKRVIKLLFLAIDLEIIMNKIELSKEDRYKLSSYDKDFEKRILDVAILELGKRLVIENDISPEFVRGWKAHWIFRNSLFQKPKEYYEALKKANNNE